MLSKYCGGKKSIYKLLVTCILRKENNKIIKTKAKAKAKAKTKNINIEDV